MKKKLIGLALSMVMIQPVMGAQDGANAFMRCARKIVKKQIGGMEGVERLGDILTALSNEGDFVAAKKDCKELISTMEPQRDIARNEYIDSALAISYALNSVGASTVLGSLVNPTIRCSTLGVGVSAAVLVSAGASGEIGRCLSSDGKRFAIIAASGELGGGLGVSAHLTGRQFTMSQKQLVDMQTSEGIVYGAGVSFGLYTDGSSIDGFNAGVGIGLYAAKKLGVSLKVIPLFSNNKDLIAELMN